MGKVIGVIAIKGGVGKTTLSASIATDLVQHHGKKVLLVDANYSAPNLGLHMDILAPEKTIHDVLSGKLNIKDAIHTRFGVDVIPGSYVYPDGINHMKLRDKLNSLKKDYDFIVLDSSPSLNEEILSTMLSSDALFVVTTPDYPTLSCTLKAAKLAQNRGRPIAGMIINKIRDPAYELSLKNIEKTVGFPVVARIPDDKHNVRALFTRIPMPLYKRNSKFAKEIYRLTSAITLKKAPKSWFHRMLGKDFRREEVNREVMRDNFYSKMFGD